MAPKLEEDDAELEEGDHDKRGVGVVVVLNPVTTMIWMIWT